MRDVVAQLDELTAIVADVVELARGDAAPGGVTEEVRLDEVTARVVDQMRIHAARSSCGCRPSRRRPGRCDAGRPRRSANLVHQRARVEPRRRHRRGHGRRRNGVGGRPGPGHRPAEANRLFERFYRAPAARGRPGSGLGLAIVRQVADSYGATATIRQRDGGGAVASLAFA